MLRLILRRLGLGVATLWLVSVFIFAGTEILPGDVAQTMLGRTATPEALAELRQQLHLDEPAIQRYGSWLAGFATGNLGVSPSSGRSIAGIIADRFPNTLLLASLTALFAVPLGLALGLLAVIHARGRLDRFITIFSLCTISVPEFFVAAALVLILAVHLHWVPAVAYITEFGSIGHLLRSLAIPILTLSFGVMAYLARMTRAAVLNVMESPYVEMAILSGVPRGRVVWRHALPNALGPIVNVIALSLASLIRGTVVVEVMFAYPGLAKLTVDAVSLRDMPLIQACAMIFSAVYILLLMFADVLAILANPRLRHPAQEATAWR
ncbi:MAG: ABC transporter permease [Arenicellales bacterium]